MNNLNYKVMKIRFKDSADYCFIEIPIICLSYQVDDDGKPIDIFIWGTEKNIKLIEEYAMVGSNCRKAEDYEIPVHNEEYLNTIKNGEDIWMCLIARLPEFKVTECHQVIYR